MRPRSFLKDSVLPWTIRVYNAAGQLIDADSTPSVIVRKNGSAVGDSVTVTKRSSTTGIYDCTYNPAGEVDGDLFELVETVIVSGLSYPLGWYCSVVVPERGTDNANTATPPTTAQIEAALLNEGDGQALVAAIIARVEADLDSADLSVQAIANAVRDSILNRVLAGNHDNAGTTGKLLQKLNVSGTLAHSDDAATYRPSDYATDAALASAQTQILSRLPAALVSGRMDASLGASQTDGLSAAGLSAGAVSKIAAQITADHGSGSYAGSGGLTTDEAAALTRIDGRTALITGSGMPVVGPVTPGGALLLIVGNDYVTAAGSRLDRTITDPGGALHARLTAAGTTLSFGAGRNGQAGMILGTVTSVNYSAGITTIGLEITHSQISSTAPSADDYTYQIQRTVGGNSVVEVSDALSLERRYVPRPS